MNVNLDLVQYLVHHQPTQHVERMLRIIIFKFYIRNYLLHVFSNFKLKTINLSKLPFRGSSAFQKMLVYADTGLAVCLVFRPMKPLTSHRKLKMMKVKS